MKQSIIMVADLTGPLTYLTGKEVDVQILTLNAKGHMELGETASAKVLFRPTSRRFSQVGRKGSGKQRAN